MRVPTISSGVALATIILSGLMMLQRLGGEGSCTVVHQKIEDPERYYNLRVASLVVEALGVFLGFSMLLFLNIIALLQYVDHRRDLDYERRARARRITRPLPPLEEEEEEEDAAFDESPSPPLEKEEKEEDLRSSKATVEIPPPTEDTPAALTHRNKKSVRIEE